jgi:endonuclease YncB( thermonuclease family)
MRPLIFALVILAAGLPAHAEVTGKPRVIDGDTIEIAGERIRLHGIDAPESKQTCTNTDGKVWRCGQDATFALANLIGDHWITCKGSTRDRYGRLIAICYAGDHDLNAKMVGEGWALAYRRYSMDYVEAETAAKEAEVGMWRGEFVPPWEWRKARR